MEVTEATGPDRGQQIPIQASEWAPLPVLGQYPKQGGDGLHPMAGAKVKIQNTRVSPNLC